MQIVNSGWLTIVLALAVSGSATAEKVIFSSDFAPSEGWVKQPEKPYRSDICLNGSWQFQPVIVPGDWKRNTGVGPELTMPESDKWEKVSIKIPSPWNVNTWGGGRDTGEGSKNPYWPSSVYYPSYPSHWDGVEMGWLKRTFSIAKPGRGRRLVLHFEAVAGDAQVFVNGKKAGEHIGSHLPFEIDVTDLIEGGKNELLVGVRAMHLFDELSDTYKKMRSPYPPGSTTDNLKGIWQDVFLLDLPAVRVADVFVKPLVDRDSLEVEVTLRNDSDSEQKIQVGGDVQTWLNLAGDSLLNAPEPRWRLGPVVMKLPAGEITLKPGESRVISLGGKVDGCLKLWSPDEPNLYGLVLFLTSGREVLDQSYTRFGWRQFKISGKTFLLNGKEIKMYGDLLHPFGPFVNSRRYIWAWYKMIKDMHGNAVRPHAQPHSRHYLDLADEMGVMVLDETAMFGSSIKLNFESPVAWDRYAKHYDDLILRDRNHPSVFGWSWGNELFAIFIYDKAITKEQADIWYGKLGELGMRGRRLDPTRDWISCDGDEDVRGTMPVWNKHVGHGLPGPGFLPANIDKPLMVGESGGSYYARPNQLTMFNGEHAYESYLGRNEALAIDVYDNLVNMAIPSLVFYSPAETAWFGLEHLNIGYSDFTRLPNANDGVWFKPFEEGKPGIQPERIPSYVCTFNPGWDPDIPLYRPLPMFEAQKAALAKGGPKPCPWDHRVKTQKREAPAVAASIKSIGFIGSPNSELPEKMTTLGLPMADTVRGASTELVIVDGQTVTDKMFSDYRYEIHTVLQNKGIVLVMVRDGAERNAALQKFLNAEIRTTKREATALVPGKEHKWTAGLSLADLYFAEDPTDKLVLKLGLDGEFIDKADILLEASNTDWSLFNNAPEFAKCSALVLHEHLIKPRGVALAGMKSGNGYIIVSSIDIIPGSEANVAFWQRIFSSAGVKIGEASGGNEKVQKAFNGKNALVRALVLGMIKAGAPDKAISEQFIDESGNRIEEGEKAGGAVWKQYAALGEDRYNFDQFDKASPADGYVTYFSFWISSPVELADLLMAGPDAPKVGFLCYTADEMKLFVNGAHVANPQMREADYRKLEVFDSLPLKKGWNHVFIKVAAKSANGSEQGTLAVRLTCDKPAFLSQLRTAVQQ